MYKTVINLDDDEVIQFEAPEATVEYNGARINIAVMITNKRIIFLQNMALFVKIRYSLPTKK